ncbi:MAG: hypothetical protein ABIM32_01790 [candidate division WOR-3 bacterium]
MSESSKRQEGLRDQEIEQLLKSNNILERLKAVDLLIERKEIDKLISLLFSESWHLREKIQNSLGKVIKKDHLNKLLPLLDEKVWYVRAGVIKVLGDAEFVDLFDDIYPHLREKNEVVRTNAAVAIAKFITKRSELKERLTRDDIVIIENALRELKEFDLLDKFMNL